ncbi:Aspartyl/glutamyl-tRNA(Asn/Gln) amidotransferase subunit B [Seminavis robusta]|uniref:Aspartyl/glutamyl-tRNA(Asn/Gln) amidotransferase subunit B n=1 Tax=Seminavis robusta TaxID=568900 RepID=A0A9N8ECG6_9STRA|nr:Aspartyl/glutamyl-tRNA(Asn/Gln) amidotransferase subunit B [Seminavis robusta]|eukprot:Sro969_g226290.1 Aspartyl/glutamyl-tRNA(Asn/Gln) amidotransferase subunit B (280) ;mRNA; r:40300-41139
MVAFQETRTFHVKSGQTILIRSKEGDEDYRFMPEPDLPPIVLDEKVLGGHNSVLDYLAEYLPELPDAARERLAQEYQLDEYTARVIAGDPPAIRICDQAVATAQTALLPDDNSSSREIAQTVAKFLCNDLFALIRDEEGRRRAYEGAVADNNGEYSNITGPQLGEIVVLLLNGTISTTMAKKLLALLYQEELGQSPSEVAKRHGLQLISDHQTLERLCHETLEQNPEQLEQYRRGGKHVAKMKKFLVGKAMSHSRGNAHPERLHEALEVVLEEVAPGVQ